MTWGPWSTSPCTKTSFCGEFKPGWVVKTITSYRELVAVYWLVGKCYEIHNYSPVSGLREGWKFKALPHLFRAGAKPYEVLVLFVFLSKVLDRNLHVCMCAILNSCHHGDVFVKSCLKCWNTWVANGCHHLQSMSITDGLWSNISLFQPFRFFCCSRICWYF